MSHPNFYNQQHPPMYQTQPPTQSPGVGADQQQQHGQQQGQEQVNPYAGYNQQQSQYPTAQNFGAASGTPPVGATPLYTAGRQMPPTSTMTPSPDMMYNNTSVPPTTTGMGAQLPPNATGGGYGYTGSPNPTDNQLPNIQNLSIHGNPNMSTPPTGGYPQQQQMPPQMGQVPQHQGGYQQQQMPPQMGQVPQQQGGYQQQQMPPQMGQVPQQQGGFQQFNPYAQQNQPGAPMQTMQPMQPGMVQNQQYQQFNPYGNQPGAPMQPMQPMQPGQQPGMFGGLPNVQVSGQPGQQAPRIASSQVPSATTVLDQYKSYFYRTNQENPTLPPPSSVQQFCIDAGNARPNFMRSSMYTIPETEDQLNQTHIPFIIHTTPFAPLTHPADQPVSQVVHPSGPVQCRRCHAYSNPFNIFTNGGKYFTCKFCEFDNQVEKEYFSATLPNGVRTDFEERPELKYGSYEFLLSNPPPAQLPAYIFAIEVSAFTMQTGIVHIIIEALKRILNTDPSLGLTPSRFGIITFDTEVQFWSFKKTYNKPQMKVLAKNSVFVPVEDGFLVDYKESKHLIDYFFDNIQTFFKHPQAIQREIAFGPAIQSASLALEKCGGRVFTFTSCLPKGSIGQIEKREKSLQASTKALADFYKPLYQANVKMNVSMDFFCIPAEICDLITSGQVASHTGGNIFYYPNFNPEYHSDQLFADIVSDATSEFGINATAKLRCSAGITVSNHFGYFSENANDIQFAGISSSQTLSSTIKYDDKLKPKSKAYLQFAMIYTNLRGETRIRVHNLRLNTDSSMANFFRDADLDSIVAYFARIASKDIVSSTPSNIRTTIVDKSVEILTAYRKHCAADKAPTQLILPELFKLMPIYMLAMMKTPPFRLSPEISPDLRFFYMSLYTTASPNKITPLIYPRLYPIHNLKPHEGLPKADADDHIVLPVFERLAAEHISQNGIYIFDDGRTIQFWIHQFASTLQLKQLFGVESIVGFNSRKLYQLYESSRDPSNDYHKRVDNIVQAITQLRGHKSRTLQFSQSVQSDPMDSYFKSIFYEDKGVDSISYVDFLCQVHKQIQNKLS